jgi:hypothetical protein
MLLRYSDEICQINHNLSPDWSNPQVRFTYYYLGYLTVYAYVTANATYSSYMAIGHTYKVMVIVTVISLSPFPLCFRFSCNALYRTCIYTKVQIVNALSMHVSLNMSVPCNCIQIFYYFSVTDASSLGRYVFGSEISYNKAPPRLPGLGC